ncbi:hypothetical protein RRG08_060484 [Elysia crispata]|uniref:Uncharacterized protein n=1 Tax=Elysia crispata TaxID=231223 RepID=A0AAE1B0S2_9GAST|nr:hypothetical protein RRG08_060484 [Elysia crispata]
MHMIKSSGIRVYAPGLGATVQEYMGDDKEQHEKSTCTRTNSSRTRVRVPRIGAAGEEYMQEEWGPQDKSKCTRQGAAVQEYMRHDKEQHDKGTCTRTRSSRKKQMDQDMKQQYKNLDRLYLCLAFSAAEVVMCSSSFHRFLLISCYVRFKMMDQLCRRDERMALNQHLYIRICGCGLVLDILPLSQTDRQTDRQHSEVTKGSSVPRLFNRILHQILNVPLGKGSAPGFPQSDCLVLPRRDSCYNKLPSTPSQSITAAINSSKVRPIPSFKPQIASTGLRRVITALKCGAVWQLGMLMTIHIFLLSELDRAVSFPRSPGRRGLAYNSVLQTSTVTCGLGTALMLLESFMPHFQFAMFTYVLVLFHLFHLGTLSSFSSGISLILLIWDLFHLSHLGSPSSFSYGISFILFIWDLFDPSHLGSPSSFSSGIPLILLIWDLFDTSILRSL